MSQYFERRISKYQFHLRKVQSAQHWFGALLTDLSKACDCLPHDIITVKLYAIGWV